MPKLGEGLSSVDELDGGELDWPANVAAKLGKLNQEHREWLTGSILEAEGVVEPSGGVDMLSFVKELRAWCPDNGLVFLRTLQAFVQGEEPMIFYCDR